MRDGGAFVLPDSGWFYDGGHKTLEEADAGPPDSGPYVCDPPCAAPQVCGCVLSGRLGCGCHATRAYAASCDPQVPAICEDPLICSKARTLSGADYVCSDGREGAPCSRVAPFCRTARGCQCIDTPFGASCSCQGTTNGSAALLCDPRDASPCPEGRTCVRVETPSGTFHMCSAGGEHEPCEVGDGSCMTTLGCTCPFERGRRVCRCSEPGTHGGYPCDPTVRGACVEPLACEIRGSPIGDGYTSECTARMQTSNDPFQCDPAMPLCPPGFLCVEASPGVFRCRP